MIRLSFQIFMISHALFSLHFILYPKCRFEMIFAFASLRKGYESLSGIRDQIEGILGDALL